MVIKNIITNNILTRFIKEAYGEFVKVAWPKRSNVVKMTILVVLSIIIASVIFGAFDYGISKLIKYLIELQ